MEKAVVLILVFFIPYSTILLIIFSCLAYTSLYFFFVNIYIHILKTYHFY